MGKKSKSLSREKLVSEITRLKGLIKKSQAGESMSPDFNYRETLWTLEHMRNKMRCLKKEEKKNVG